MNSLGEKLQKKSVDYMKEYHTKRKIKVCHIIAKMVYGGGSIGTLHLALDIDSSIFQNTIICGRQSEQEGNLLQDIDTKDINVIIIPELVRELKLHYDLVVLLKLIKILKKNKYDIIHTHGSKAGVIGRFAAAICRIPVVLYTVHGWGLKAGSFVERTLFRFIEKTVASFTTLLLFQTKADIEEAVAFNIGEKNQYCLIGNGINLQPLFSYNRRKAKKIMMELASGKIKIVGTVGRVSAQKNPYGFIKIAQKVLEKKKNTVFIFVGGGELLAEMKNKIANLGLSDNILFTGVRNDVPEVLANFDVFILPSFWEGLPRSVIEAMAMSKPVVVHDISGIGELVVDGKNGFIVPTNNTDAYANRILYLLDNPDIAQTMGYKGFIKAKDFDYDRVVERVKKLYLHYIDR